MKLLNWILLFVSAALACFARLQLWGTFDADALPLPLSPESLALPMLLVVAAVVFFLLARRLPAQRELCAGIDSYFAFDSTTLPMMLVVIGCFALLASAVLAALASAGTMLALVMAAFLVAGAVCLLAALFALRRGTAFSGIVLLVPVCALVLRLIFFYRENTADPVLRHFYVETLALAALTLLLLEFAAFAFRGGAPRLFQPLCALCVILCTASVTGCVLDCGEAADAAFYAGGAFLALGLLGAEDFEP